jgi:signal transduction histidine kinase
MIAFFTFDSKSEKLNLQVKYNFDEVAVYNIIPDQITLREIKRGAVAVRGCVEPGLNIRIIEVESLSKGNIGLMFPILSSGELSAILILGRKKSGQRFFAEDLDLLNQIINETGTAIEKILLRENVNNERLKKEKLEEVNQLKSLFVSNVSHEFKTPLTSIKIFSELLEGSGDITSSKHLDYLKVINGESDRLSRMIENVLDIVKIERGIKEYHFTEVNLNDLVTEALKIMEYQLKIQKFTVYTQFVEFQENIFADRDAIIECILNLLSNSIKYSREIKEIIISTFSQDSRQVVCIEDKGIGIRQEDINKIFEAYFRAKDEETQRIPGTGLGLAIIKHVMDAHNGNIEIKSEVQKGTCFKLIFQVGKSNEKYINH